ncbi:MAG: hypothetical protein EXX96DRAFT_644677 [Benjaminiella poitrasii]|nr:MAG: hypothetical protein EXX96DRAFT_644677 [Benjaminiella poitrasii]
MEETQVTSSFAEPSPQNKVTEGYVCRCVESYLTTTRLNKSFISSLKDKARRLINSQNPHNETLIGTVSHRKKDISDQEKRTLDEFVARTIHDIRNNAFKSLKFTDPHGLRLFTMVLIYSYQMRFVQFDNQAFLRLVNKSLNVKLHTDDEKGLVGIYYGLFDKRKVGFSSFESLYTGGKTFNNIIRSNSYEIEFVCRRKKRDEAETLSSMDIAAKVELTSENTTVWGVYPGLKDVYIGSDGSSNNRHRDRKTSQSEYYDICGYNRTTKRRKAYDEQHVDTVNIINRIPTLKTIILQSYLESTRYILVNYNNIVDYFSHQEFLKNTKYGYMLEERIRQNEQKWKPLDPQDSIDEEGKAMVIAFGDASIPTSMADIRSSSNNLLRKHLQLLIKSLENATEIHSNFKIHSSLRCKTCFTWWNRDHMVSINIRYLFMYMTVNENKRSYYFQPKHQHHRELLQVHLYYLLVYGSDNRRSSHLPQHNQDESWLLNDWSEDNRET